MEPSSVISFLANEFAAEERTGFARLAKIPSTHVQRLLAEEY
jgi:hypothetical protein